MTALLGPPRPRVGRGRRGRRALVRIVSSGAIVLVVVLALLGTGCTAIRRAANVLHDLHGNRATVNVFESKISNAPASFEVRYVTTGTAPATVVYAVNQPASELAFTETPTASGSPSIEVIANSSGEYSCQPASSSAGPTCDRLPPGDHSTESSIFDFYTPQHWVNFLKGFAATAALAGDKVSSSDMTLNGFKMSCVDLVASGIPGTSTICTTVQGVLGYVKVASDTTSFEITNFSRSPPASLFQLPAGATISELPTGVTTTSA